MPSSGHRGKLKEKEAEWGASVGPWAQQCLSVVHEGDADLGPEQGELGHPGEA